MVRKMMGRTGKRVVIEDYYGYNLCRRYGGCRPPHGRLLEILSRGEENYARRLREFASFAGIFREFPLDDTVAKSRVDPVWNNGFFPALDMIALFGLIAVEKPRTYFEIGSGYSTRVAARARELFSPETRIISLDPRPRTGIDILCDEIIREPLEGCDPDLFAGLAAGDMLFFDGSHRVLQNSDNEVFFFDVIPRLRKGVYIHLHDIYWPFDYPDEWSRRMYSEQYVLGAMLLYGADVFEVVLPNVYISWCTSLSELLREVWNEPRLRTLANREGSSFWLRKRAGG